VNKKQQKKIKKLWKKLSTKQRYRILTYCYLVREEIKSQKG